MDKNNNNKNLKRKREKVSNKRWMDSEIQQLLDYLQEHVEFEKPTAQIFYRKFLEASPIDASWDIVRWKVKNLRTAYNKAEAWRKSTGAGLVEEDKGVATVHDKLRKMCRFYDELNAIFGRKDTEFVFEVHDSAIDDNLGLNSTPVAESSVQGELLGFECIDDYRLTPVIQYAGPENSEADEVSIEVLETESAPVPEASEPQVSRAEQNIQQTNKAVREFTAKLKRAAPKNSLDQLSQIQSERNSFLKMKIEFEKEKFKKEFELNEKRFAVECEMEKEKLALKKLEMEKEERLRRLEIEKQERIERFEIEMRYKYQNKN